ncbi:Clavaminate synthase-like protein [Parathielavia hyrcaniae]|uniref:Clavaminate synthase-like protein n=1 Tax=Parathielavia hyrcaniae TaxID=113614 RepID=A0AAN6T0D4_9PEZI|nr:Clavaminate synthase-like protein [Parathielavia hyrcaniae]
MSQADRQGKPIVFRQQVHQDESIDGITPPISLPALRKWFSPTPHHHHIAQLYIAQLPLSDLPTDLQQDAPTPDALAAEPTRELPYAADVYTSSLWLGLEPTFTPWHRDPNPNLFCQLVGSKTVRLMPPAPGKQLFADVSAGRLGRLNASHAIRGLEMMQSNERKAWWDAVWGPSVPEGMQEVVLRPRDVLFLPLGWWHSVRSAGGGIGSLNASVNWWFRWRKVARLASSSA